MITLHAAPCIRYRSTTSAWHRRVDREIKYDIPPAHTKALEQNIRAETCMDMYTLQYVYMYIIHHCHSISAYTLCTVTNHS